MEGAAVREFAIQYFDGDGELKVAYVKARNKEEAVEKLREEWRKHDGR